MKVTRWIGDLEEGQVLTVHSGYFVRALSDKGPRKDTADLLPGEKVPFIKSIPSALYRKLLRKILTTWHYDECHVYFLVQGNNRALFASNKPFSAIILPAMVNRLPFEAVQVNARKPSSTGSPPMPPGISKTRDFLNYLDGKKKP